VGTGTLMATDYALRLGGVHGGTTRLGMPEGAWFVAQVSIGALSLAISWYALRTIPHRWIQLSLLLAEAALGFMLYAFAALCYIVGTGIDSL
jgi:hypothetical protein